MAATALSSHTSTARRIPHNYLEQAGQKVETLLKEGVIVRSPEATPWLNPAFLSPKIPRANFVSLCSTATYLGSLFVALTNFRHCIKSSPAYQPQHPASPAWTFKDGIFRSSSVQSCQTWPRSSCRRSWRRWRGSSSQGRLTDEALFNTGCPGTAFGSQVFKCVDDTEAPGQDVWRDTTEVGKEEHQV